MKKNLLITIALVANSITTLAQSTWTPNITIPRTTNSSYANTTLVSGYTRTNGTFVSSYRRTRSNDTNIDNFSTIGNSNPFSGQRGSRAKDYSTGALNYGVGQNIRTGSRGGNTISIVAVIKLMYQKELIHSVGKI